MMQQNAARQMLTIVNKVLAVVACVSIAFATVANAEEVIKDYAVRIYVNPDSSLTIREQITVHAEGDAIRRGIYRDFPVLYKDRFGHVVKVGFKVLGVLRNGEVEDYHEINLENGVRVYIGNAERTISVGEHRYELSFQTTRQLGFFEKHDELYFNAIGHGWDFPIERATVVVHLPQAIPADSVELGGWTGREGSQEANFDSSIVAEGIVFRVLKRLEPYEGFTIFVSWPKGYVEEPTTEDRLRLFLSDNRSSVVGLAGVIIVLLYYLAAWVKVGRDPDKGTIIPQYEPPAGIPPWEAAYLLEMKFSNRAVTSFLTDLAIRGAITICESGGVYTLIRKFELKDVPEIMDVGILQKLFPLGSEMLELKDDNYERVSAARNYVRNLVEEKHKNRTIYMNLIPLGVGVVLALLVVALMFITVQHGSRFDSMAKLVNVILVGILLFMPLLFSKLLKRPTRAARKIMDHLEGYKLYMETAERERFESAKPMTPDLYEQFLPYAIALGVEQAWTALLKSSLLAAQQKAYQPKWYVGSDIFSSSSSFASSGFSSSLSSAIASSSSPPGSSSGGGGGGSSGGGGGGGGGGGW